MLALWEDGCSEMEIAMLCPDIPRPRIPLYVRSAGWADWEERLDAILEG